MLVLTLMLTKDHGAVMREDKFWECELLGSALLLRFAPILLRGAHRCQDTTHTGSWESAARTIRAPTLPICPLLQCRYHVWLFGRTFRVTATATATAAVTATTAAADYRRYSISFLQLAGPVLQLAVGGRHVCALLDGAFSVQCWGTLNISRSQLQHSLPQT